MKTKNNSKKVEKTPSYSVVDVILDVEQGDKKRNAYVHLVSNYRVAYTSGHSLSEFVQQLKSNPTKYHKSVFRSHTPLKVTVTIDMVDLYGYTIGRKLDFSALFVLRHSETLHKYENVECNRTLLDYQPNIDLQ